MKVHRDLSDVPRLEGGRAVAVGTFDGVHLGHRRVIGDALEWGRAHDVPAAVVTFDPHPLSLLRPDDPPRLLTPTSVKADLIEELGVDELVLVGFTEEFSRLTAEQFAGDVLAGDLGARHVSVGENFRFGHRASGDPELLRSRDEYEVTVVPLVEQDGRPVSSTRIRELLADGDVAEAARLLGSPFHLEGVVSRGSERGRTLGVPTANITPLERVALPAAGVYAGLALGHPAAINVGVRPTFESEGQLLVEAHLLNFEGDLYDRTMRLSFLERLRPEERFSSADALVEQMQRDIEHVRKIASAHGTLW
jgi:riboflavin kinase / FMN adenylyltransferase